MVIQDKSVDVNLPLPSTKMVPLAIASARGDVSSMTLLLATGARLDGPDPTVYK